MVLVDTAPAQDVAASAAPSARRFGTHRLEWGAALKAWRRLVADKEDTAQVFEIMRALNGRSTAKGYRRLIATVHGGRMAYERAEFSRRLADDAWLDSLPAGSVGASYREFVRREALSAESLAQASVEGLPIIEEPHPYAWFGRRIRDVHDIWHVLTGYDRDIVGEACLTGFSYGQTGGLGWGFIAVGAAARLRRPGGGSYAGAIWQGYRLGKAANWLLAEDYERLMAEPLAAARRRLKLQPPTAYAAIPQIAREQADNSWVDAAA